MSNVVTAQDPCVVVGAGPVGLIAALALRRQGLRVIVVEAEPEDRARAGSRAIGLFYPTLRRLNAVVPGLGDDVAWHGVGLRGYDAFYGDRRVFHFRADPGSWNRMLAPWRWGTSVPQKVTERLVHEEAVKHGVEFRWQSPVTSLDSDAGGVTIELEGGEQIRASYVIGADGARSVVRKQIGASMEGFTDDTPFIIVDVDEHPDGSTPTSSGYFHYGCPKLGGRNVMHMPFAGGMRVDLQCLPTDDAEQMASPEGVREWMSKILDPWYGEHIQWVSTYRFHQVVAESYTDPQRRVLLAGEAAHLFAPWGGRGLNSGVMDATDAATAIAGALATDDPAQARRLIERCAENRRKWGQRNRDVSSEGLRVMRASDRRTGVQRELAARLAPVFPPAGAWLANAPIQVRPPRPGSWDVY
jgi:3-(3-hydroxy-phenyl)propionate hydroxylase